jgi:hypothetical protein
MHGRLYLWQINQEMEAKFPVVFVVFCFVLYGHHMQVLISYMCVCVCVCEGGDLLD